MPTMRNPLLQLEKWLLCIARSKHVRWLIQYADRHIYPHYFRICLIGLLLHAFLSFAPLLDASHSSLHFPEPSLAWGNYKRAMGDEAYLQWLLVGIFIATPMGFEVILDVRAAMEKKEEQEQWIATAVLVIFAILPNAVLYCLLHYRPSAPYGEVSDTVALLRFGIVRTQYLYFAFSLLAMMFGRRNDYPRNVHHALLNFSVEKRTVNALLLTIVGRSLTLVGYSTTYRGLLTLGRMCFALAALAIVLLVIRMIVMQMHQYWKHGKQFITHHHLSDFMICCTLAMFTGVQLAIQTYASSRPPRSSMQARTILLCDIFLQLALVSAVQLIASRKSKRLAEIKHEKLETRLNLIRYVSHEMRTPLNTAFMGLTLVGEDLGGWRQKLRVEERLEQGIQVTRERLGLITRSTSGMGTNESPTSTPRDVHNHLAAGGGGGGALSARSALDQDFSSAQDATPPSSPSLPIHRRSDGRATMGEAPLSNDLNLSESFILRPLHSKDVTHTLETLHHVSDACQVALATLDDLLTFDKIDEQKLVVEMQDISPWAFVCAAAKPFSINASQAQVKFSVRLADRESGWAKKHFIRGDPFKLSQVLRNLISNALKFTPAGGTVQVCLQRDPHFTAKEMVRVSVTDSGAGISTQNQKKLFGQYVQFNAGALQQGKGSGLGLWITKSIVQMHSGHIGVVSEGEGLGSMFYVDLPLFKKSSRAYAPDPDASGVLRSLRDKPSPRLSPPASPHASQGGGDLPTQCNHMEEGGVRASPPLLLPSTSPLPTVGEGSSTLGTPLPGPSLPSPAVWESDFNPAEPERPLSARQVNNRSSRSGWETQSPSNRIVMPRREKSRNKRKRQHGGRRSVFNPHTWWTRRRDSYDEGLDPPADSPSVPHFSTFDGDHSIQDETASLPSSGTTNPRSGWRDYLLSWWFVSSDSHKLDDARSLASDMESGSLHSGMSRSPSLRRGVSGGSSSSLMRTEVFLNNPVRVWINKYRTSMRDTLSPVSGDSHSGGSSEGERGDEEDEPSLGSHGEAAAPHPPDLDLVSEGLGESREGRRHSHTPCVRRFSLDDSDDPHLAPPPHPSPSPTSSVVPGLKKSPGGVSNFSLLKAVHSMNMMKQRESGGRVQPSLANARSSSDGDCRVQSPVSLAKLNLPSPMDPYAFYDVPVGDDAGDTPPVHRAHSDVDDRGEGRGHTLTASQTSPFSLSLSPAGRDGDFPPLCAQVRQYSHDSQDSALSDDECTAPVRFSPPKTSVDLLAGLAPVPDGGGMHTRRKSNLSRSVDLSSLARTSSSPSFPLRETEGVGLSQEKGEEGDDPPSVQVSNQHSPQVPRFSRQFTAPLSMHTDGVFADLSPPAHTRTSVHLSPNSETVHHTLVPSQSLAPEGRVSWQAGLKLMVVDDSAANRKMCVRVLTAHKQQAYEACDGQQCVDVFLQHRETGQRPFDVILLDDNMPRLSGPQAARLLREKGFVGPIVGVTGDVHTEAVHRFEAHGATCVLPKPLDLDVLRARLQL